MITLKNLFIIICLSIISLNIFGQTNHSIPIHKVNPNTDLFINYLQDSLWSQKYAYDATHYLMVPIHYAYLTQNDQLISAFDLHFSNMVNAYSKGNVTLSRLKEIQYLSLASRYLALTDKRNELTSDLAQLIESRYWYYWEQSSAWQWGHKSFNGGIKERIDWKLSKQKTQKNYFKAIIDEEMFIIGIAADLYSYYKNNSAKRMLFIEPILVFSEIISDRQSTNIQGWDYQENIWLDHRDYAYAGYYTQPDSTSMPSGLKTIQQDCSHSMRWPLWLLQIGNIINTQEYRNQLKWQLLNVTIDTSQNAKVPMLNNYMDGHNGYFRWSYSSHKNSGYPPYKLSSSFSLGWWSFLGGMEIASNYYKIHKAYPFDDAVVSLYKPISNRVRHPLIQDEKTGHELRQSISLMALYIALNSNKLNTPPLYETVQACIISNSQSNTSSLKTDH